MTKAVQIEMTPERKARFERLSSSLIDQLMKETNSPMEALVILTFMIESIEEAAGISLQGVIPVQRGQEA